MSYLYLPTEQWRVDIFIGINLSYLINQFLIQLFVGIFPHSQCKAVSFQEMDLGKSSAFEKWGFQLELFLQRRFTSIGYCKYKEVLTYFLFVSRKFRYKTVGTTYPKW